MSDLQLKPIRDVRDVLADDAKNSAIAVNVMRDKISVRIWTAEWLSNSKLPKAKGVNENECERSQV